MSDRVAAEPTTGVIILAAGESKRMGKPKQLLPYGGQSLLRHSIQAAVNSLCLTTVVVIGSHADELRQDMTGTGVTIAHNPDWAKGPGTTIKAGVKAMLQLGGEVRSIVLMLCDQPLVSSETINRLIVSHRQARKLIVASAYADTVGVPALFSHELFDKLLSLADVAGAKQLILNHLSDTVTIPFEEAAIDLDTPGEYEDYLRSAGQDPGIPGETEVWRGRRKDEL